MIFDYPWLLLLAPVLAGVFGVIALVARRRRVARAAAWSASTGQLARGSGRWSPVIMAGVGLLCSLALAGPRGGRTTITTESRALSVALAMDISRSTDCAPHAGHGGLGLVELDRYSSKRVSHDSQRYS